VALIQPLFVAIDSSILAFWAQEAFSQDPEPQTRARAVLKSLLDSNWVAVLCWHHFEELIRHPALHVAADRVAFLKSLPYVAWIANLVERDELGSIADLFAAEVKAIVVSDNLGLPALLTSVRQDIVRYGAPTEIATFEHWRDLRPLLAAKAPSEQEIASIVHAESTIKDNAKIAGLKNAPARGRDSLKQFLSSQAMELERILSLRGDPRIADPKHTATKFTKIMSNDIFGMLDRGGTPLDAFIKQFDVPESDISGTTTLGEFKLMARRRKLSRSAAERLGMDLDQIWPKLRAAKIPSEIIQQTIRRARKPAPRASGSDLGDDYLACLAPYVDAVVADKRTHEFLAQGSRRDHSFAQMVGFFAKVSSYIQLPTALAGYEKWKESNKRA
jgi:hypothetical protein